MDLAELGYKIDSSGLVDGTKALDDNAAAADKAGVSAERLGNEFKSMSRTIDQSSKALGDRLGGALDRIGVGTGLAVSELQLLNKTQTEMLSYLTSLDQKLVSAGLAMQALGQAGSTAAKGTAEAVTASQRMEQELAQQEARYKSVAQQAMAWVNTNSAANLSDRALAEAAEIAASGIDVQAQAMARAGTEQERMAARAKALQEAEARATNQAREAASAAQAQELNLKKLLGQIDPTVAALNRLADMEEQLEKAADLGMIKPQQFQQFQGQIDATRQKILNAGKGVDELGGAFGRLNLKTAESQRNLAQMVQYLATGNFGMAGNQIMQLGNSAGVASALFSGAGIAVGGFTALVIAGIMAWKQGTDELHDFQQNLLLTGRSADLSAAQYAGMVSQLDNLAGVSSTNAVHALTSVSQSGKLAGDSFMLVAEAAARMEESTGQAASKTVAAFEKIADDPVAGLLSLNDAVGGLNRAQLAHIVTLQQEGREQQAVAEATLLAKQRMDELADEADAKMPAVTKWWHGVSDEITGAWQEAKTYGAMIDEIIQKHAALRNAQNAASIGNTAGSIFGLGGLIPQGRLSAFATVLNAAGKQYLGGLGASNGLPTPIYDPGDDNRKDVSEYTKVLQESEVAEKAASDALNSRISNLDRVSAKQAAYNKIVEQYNALSDKDPRHFDGSMERLIAQANAQIDKQFNQREGLNKKDPQVAAYASLINQINQQTAAIDAQALSTDKLTAAQKLSETTKASDVYKKASAAEKEVVDAKLAHIVAQDQLNQQAVQTQRGMQASIALTERLTQLEKQHQEQADIDLMGIGRGADATQMLQRQLDIQRQYLREQEKLDKAQRDKNTALSQADYQQQQAALDASLSRSLDIERNYQQQRMALLGDWHTGFTRAWEDYVFAAQNASDRAASFLTSSLGAGEDAFVQFAKTGKVSVTGLVDTIVEQFARLAYQKSALGIGNLLSGIFGQSAAATQGYVDDFTAIYGGGRASGGPVSRGSYYEVGENDRPELYQQGGKSYLIPGNDGTVIPMAAGSGGNGPAPTPQFNISIQKGADEDRVETKPNGSGGMDIQVLIKKQVQSVLGSGDADSVLRTRYNLRPTV